MFPFATRPSTTGAAAAVCLAVCVLAALGGNRELAVALGGATAFLFVITMVRVQDLTQPPEQAYLGRERCDHCHTPLKPDDGVRENGDRYCDSDCAMHGFANRHGW
jgi:hypothetical protein